MKRQNDISELRLQGVPASPGIALGHALSFRKLKTSRERRSIPPKQVNEEINRVVHAFERSVHELQKIKQTALQRLGAQGAMIFEAQLLMLLDETLKSSITEEIKKDHVDAETAIYDQFLAIEQPLRASQDPLMRERAADFVDLRQRVLRSLQHEKVLSKFEGEAVIVAETLSPADALVLSKNHVLRSEERRVGKECRSR